MVLYLLQVELRIFSPPLQYLPILLYLGQYKLHLVAFLQLLVQPFLVPDATHQLLRLTLVQEQLLVIFSHLLQVLLDLRLPAFDQGQSLLLFRLSELGERTLLLNCLFLLQFAEFVLPAHSLQPDLPNELLMPLRREDIGRVLLQVGTFVFGVKQLILPRLLLHPLLIAEQPLHRLSQLLPLEQLIHPALSLLNFENTGLYPSTHPLHHAAGSPLGHLPSILLFLLGEEVDEVLPLLLLFGQELIFILERRHHIIQSWLEDKMKNVLFLGGSGQLGSKVLALFSPYNVVNVDFRPHQQAKRNILLQKDTSVADNNRLALDQIKSANLKYDAILVTAGGWTGGSIKDEDYLQKVRMMNEVNLYPSLLAAHLATKYLTTDGLVVFTGAAAVYKEPQPDMIAYALAKAGVHYLATSLAEKAEKKEGIQGRVITILPETIDTPTNRQAMPTADFSKWSKPQLIGQLLKSWVQGLNVPSNGSFVLLKVKNECLQPEFL